MSKFGEYRGYSKEIYTEYVRISHYVKVRDGTKLAVDIFRPTINGVPESKPLFVVWTHTRYTRARIIDGKMWTQLSETPWGSYEKTLVKHGYIVGAVDVRGGGASFGVRHGEFNLPEAYDAYDVTEFCCAALV